MVKINLQSMYSNHLKVQTQFEAGLLLTAEQELLNKISLGFDRFILTSLKPKFPQEGFGEIEFIEALLKSLEGFDGEMPQRQLRLVNALDIFYQEITMGRHDKVTWEMFSNFLIGSVRQIKSKQDAPYTYSHSSLNPKIKFANPIAKCVCVKEAGLVMMFQEGSNKVHVVDVRKGILLPHCLENQPRKLFVETSTAKKQKGRMVVMSKQLMIPTNVSVIDILYLNESKFNMLMCSTSLGNVKGWTYSHNGFQLAFQPQSQNLPVSHTFPHAIHSMSWDPINQVLFCGSEKGNIYAWPFKTDTEEIFQVAHESTVMCLCYIQKLQMLASGGMDGRLVFWDIVSHTKKVYKCHSRGILAMVLSDSSLLYTAGFDHLICVWNPYISGLAHRITIHSSTIHSLSLSSHYLISLDSEGNLKITNTLNMDTVFSMTLNSQNSKNEFTCMTVIQVPNRIVVCGTAVNFYDFDQDKNADLSDNIPIQGTFYLQNSLKLYAWTVEKIKTWNMLTGEIEGIFSAVSQYEISCVYYDQNRCHILIGDVSGYVSMLNLKSCLKIKQLPRQPSAVDFIVPIKAIKQNDLLAIISGYSNVNIYKIIPEGYQLIKTFQMARNTQITAVKYNQVTKQLALGTNFGSIQLYDVEIGKMTMSTQTLDMYSNVVTIQNVYLNFQLMLQVDYLGSVSVINRLPEELHRLYSTRVMETDNKAQLMRITAACWNGENTFFVGGQKGYLVACSLKPLFQQIMLTKHVVQFKKGMEILWRMRAHHESILSLTYLRRDNLVVSTAYDKRVKIWNSTSGHGIDHLRQQLYYNQTANPVFFWRLDDQGKYDIRKSDIAQKAVLKNSTTDPSPQSVAFDPRWLLDNIEIPESEMVSNKYWKTRVRFQDKCRQKIQRCLLLVRQLNARKKTKFRLLVRPEPDSVVTAAFRLSKHKHIRHPSAIFQHLGSRLHKNILQVDRPPKMDVITRAQLSAQKKFQQDVAAIDCELKHQSANNTRSHRSLNTRQSTILHSYESNQLMLPSKDTGGGKKSMINLSSGEMGALSRLSKALRSVDSEMPLKANDSIRIKKGSKK